MRLSQAPGTKFRYTEVCNEIPENFKPNFGYHRQCYSKFTNHVKQLKSANPSEVEAKEKNSGRNLRSNLAQDKCLFCQKEEPRSFIRNRVKVWENLHVLTNGLDSIISHAKSKEDNDLIQRLELYGNKTDQIKLHTTCRTEYMQKPEFWRSRSKEEKESQSELEEAHFNAFQNVCKVIEKSIIEEHNVMKLTDLREIYIQSLSYSNFPNEDYRGEKLKHKIEKHPLFSNHVSFLKLDNNNQ